MSNHRDDLMYSSDAAKLRDLLGAANTMGLVVEVYNEPIRALMPLGVLIHYNGEHFALDHFSTYWDANVWLEKQLNDFNSWR